MNPIPLSINEVYSTDLSGDITYENSSSDPSILKYRYNHIAKLDMELIYKKFSLGSSFRYNDFMKNIDKVFATTLINGNYEDNPLRDDPELNNPGQTMTYDTWEGMIPGINAAREKFKNGDFIMDCRTSYQLNDITKISLVINNLLNREYMSRPANMMPPRTIALQCNMKI